MHPGTEAFALNCTGEILCCTLTLHQRLLSGDVCRSVLCVRHVSIIIVLTTSSPVIKCSGLWEATVQL